MHNEAGVLPQVHSVKLPEPMIKYFKSIGLDGKTKRDIWINESITDLLEQTCFIENEIEESVFIVSQGSMFLNKSKGKKTRIGLNFINYKKVKDLNELIKLEYPKGLFADLIRVSIQRRINLGGILYSKMINNLVHD